MDWQQWVSLSIVAVAVVLLVWGRLRPRRFSFERDTPCGCMAGRGSPPQGSIIYRARKGERPEVTVKMK